MSIKSLPEYIANCVKNEIPKKEPSLDDIRLHLKSEIKEINTKLQEVEPLRIKRSELQKLELKLEELISSSNVYDTFEDESLEMIDIRKKIINIVKEKYPISNRGVIEAFTELNKDAYNYDEKIIRSIKYLADKGVINKNESREIVPGENWTN